MIEPSLSENHAEYSNQFISFDELKNAIEFKLLNAGASPAVAGIISENCARCERDGALSHGVFRVPGYLRSIRSGWVDAAAHPLVERVGGGFIRVDAANGFAQSALAAANEEIESAIADAGIAVVAIRDSHHFSSLWPDLEPFAESDLVGITMVTGGAAVIPRGSSAKVLGTNPFAFATPLAGHRPLVVDFATSSMSHGDLQLTAAAGETVPFGTGTGADGKDTTDPAEILEEGGLLPFGGHKGAALSIMIEILASGLTGGAFSHREDLVFAEVAEDGGTAKTGQLVILIDPNRGSDFNFSTRVADFIQVLRNSGLDRLPADHRYATRDESEVKGIPITPGIRALFEE